MFLSATHSGNTSDSIGGVRPGIPSTNDPSETFESFHELCHQKTLNDTRRELATPPILLEENGKKFSGCQIVKNFDGSPGITETAGDHLVAIDISTGKVLWEYADPSGSRDAPSYPRSHRQSGPSVANDVVIYGNQFGVIRFHDAKTGEILREMDLNNTKYAQIIDATATIVGNRIYQGTGTGGITRADRGNPYYTNPNPRLLALELCPEGTHADKHDITKCTED